MARDLSRLLNPGSIALFGGGWAANVIAQLKKAGFAGEIWPVHPKRDEIFGITCFRSLADLPSAPDASFIGVNREATIEVVRELSEMGAGGATCFASGFRESEAENTGGADLQQALVEAAGDMPVLGPNCYGFLNYLDNVTVWPDQHGGLPVTSGVGIIAQSSNIAISMTMQQRGLPIAMLVAAGNQAQTGIADIAETMLADERITAIGLYLEGFGDIHDLEAVAKKARAAGKPIAALKTGKSESARKAAITHTASMSGSAAFSSALFRRLGIVEVDEIDTFLEMLKLLHHVGPLPGPDVVSVSCSGGEAGLIADMAKDGDIHFRQFSEVQNQALKDLLGPIVTIANPLDYHTFIWGDTPLMSDVFEQVMADRFDLCVFILDIPRDDRCETESFVCAVDAIIAAKERTDAAVAVMSVLPENLNEGWQARFNEAGVVVLNGMMSGVPAIEAAIRSGHLMKAADQARPMIFGAGAYRSITLNEAGSKMRLSDAGVKVPSSVTSTDRQDAIAQTVQSLKFPVVLKATGLVHKTEANGVILNLGNEDELRAAFDRLGKGEGYLVEEMVTGGLCELIIGVSREDAGIQMLTIGAGGIFTELMKDTANLLLPVREDEVLEALRSLRIWPMLEGYRGKPGTNIAKLVEVIMAIAGFAGKDGGRREMDVNPLIACENEVIAVDALIVEWE